jgi:hypothetical protein
MPLSCQSKGLREARRFFAVLALKGLRVSPSFSLDQIGASKAGRGGRQQGNPRAGLSFSGARVRPSPHIQEDSMPRFNKRAPARPHDAEAIAFLQTMVRRDERTGCLLWTGPLMGGGYGRIGFRNQRWTAHRLSYHAHYGPIPKGMLVCHKCDVRACIAIAHLSWVRRKRTRRTC